VSPFDAQGQLVIVAALTLAGAAGVVVAPLTMLALTTTRRWAPETQRAALLVLAAAPALIALAALLAALLPSMLAMAGAPDHCHDHGGHLHLCFVHFGEHPASTFGMVLALGALAFYLNAQRHLGAGRTGSVFALGPFVGALVAIILGDRDLSWATAVAALLFALGVWLHLAEAHAHPHGLRGDLRGRGPVTSFASEHSRSRWAVVTRAERQATGQSAIQLHEGVWNASAYGALATACLPW